MTSLVDVVVGFRSQYAFRVTNYTIVILAGLGECGFQESFEQIVQQCRAGRGRQCRIDTMYERVGARTFTITNAIIEIV
jgi:hypothetical protein